jgi:hypothetical protein
VWVVLDVVLVALAAVLIALIVSIVLIVSVALTVLIAVGIDAVVIIAEADTVAVEEIAAEEGSFHFINGNSVAYRNEPLHVAGALLYKY